MSKNILITGSTDGIGFATAKLLKSLGHNVIIHGRSLSKVDDAKRKLGIENGIVADLSSILKVKIFINDIKESFDNIDVLINNAGVFKVDNPITDDNLDVRFMVNTIAPYLITKGLLDIISDDGRVVNISSAAQASVNINALTGGVSLNSGDAYSQSKLALIMWSNHMASKTNKLITSVNPGSYLGSKMVKSAYGIKGEDINIGAEIISKAALSGEFKDVSGKYFDNDSGYFSNPHPDALSDIKNINVVESLNSITS